MDFNFTQEQLERQSFSSEFAEKNIFPNVTIIEEDINFRIQIFQKMAKEGFFLQCVPQKNGGNLVDFTSYILSLKEFAKRDAGIAVAMAVTSMVAEAIEIYGTKEQKEHYFPKMLDGTCVPAAFALTEKEAGSDAKSIKTEAKPDPSDSNFYLINGKKQFITNGDIAGVLVVMTKTDPGKGSHGITAFLIDSHTPGFSVIKKERKLGLLTANLVSLSFEDCRVHHSQILGKKDEGFKIALASLDSGRLGIAAQAIGIGEAAYEAANRYARKRIQFGHPIGENQAIAFKLADMYVKLSAGKLLLYKAAWLRDQGKPFTLEASAAKLYCSEISNEIVSEALQIHGGNGYIKDYPIEKYFRDARVTTLYEGTSEIQRIIISHHILKD